MPAPVALETTVLSHGLPFPANRELARRLDGIVRSHRADPRTIGVLHGDVKTNLTDDEIEFFCSGSDIDKVSIRDLPIVVARSRNGATTVAATIHLARRAGIRVMATGGIGGVHADASGQPTWDESTDLTELARNPTVVVCSGPKAILHLEATRERLESLGVCVVGWQTNSMPAFYCGQSPFGVDIRCDTIQEIVDLVRARDRLGISSSILVCVPVPVEWAISFDDVQSTVNAALSSAEASALAPAEVTPFLLQAVRDRVGDRALHANVALLERNASIAAQLAVALDT